MKKILTIIIGILFVSTSAHAAITAGWNATSTDAGYISPTRINGNMPTVQAKNFTATTTTETSRFYQKLNVDADEVNWNDGDALLKVNKGDDTTGNGSFFGTLYGVYSNVAPQYSLGGGSGGAVVGVSGIYGGYFNSDSSFDLGWPLTYGVYASAKANDLFGLGGSLVYGLYASADDSNNGLDRAKLYGVYSNVNAGSSETYGLYINQANNGADDYGVYSNGAQNYFSHSITTNSSLLVTPAGQFSIGEDGQQTGEALISTSGGDINIAPGLGSGNSYNLDVFSGDAYSLLFQVNSTSGNVSVTNTLSSATTSSGHFIAGDGSATYPALGWSSDNDGSGTGFYRNAANRIGVTINGNYIGQMLSTGIDFATDIYTAADLSATGAVKIGGTDSAAPFRLRGVSNGVGRMTNTSETDFTRLLFGVANSSFPALNISSSTSATGVALKVVAADGTSDANLLVTGNTGAGTTTPWGRLSASTTSATEPALAIEQKSTGPAAVFLGGNVGIGTTTPSSKLSITGSSNTAYELFRLNNAGATSANTGSYISFVSENTKEIARIKGLSTTDGNNTGQIVLNPIYAGTEKNGVVVSSRGGNAKVGIGSTTPYAKLSVTGDGTSTGVNFQTTNSSNSPLFTVLDSGNVGVGTTTPFGLFGIKGAGTGTGKTMVVSDSSNNIIMSMLDNGRVKIGSTTPATTLFDVDGVISSGADGNIGGGEIRSYQVPGFYVSLTTNTSVNKSGILRSNASGDKFFVYYNTSTGDTHLNNSFSATGNIIFSNLDVETGRIRNGLWSIGATKFPAATLDITQPAISTAKTAAYDAIKATNTATSSTASVRMAGIETIVTGTNSGAGASNVGVYVSSVSGGTTNYDAIFNGTAKVGIGSTTPQTNLVVQGYTQSVIASGVATSTCNTAIEGSQVYNLGNHHLWLCMGSEPWTLLK